MPELDITPDTSAREAVFRAIGAASTCWDGYRDGGVFQSDRAGTIATELLDHLAQLERRAHPLVMAGDPIPTSPVPPGAIGYARGAAKPGEDVSVTGFDGRPILLDDETPPFYAGEALRPGQAVAIASWLQGNAVVGAARLKPAP